MNFSEFAQLKLDFRTSGGDSTQPEAKTYGIHLDEGEVLKIGK